MLRYFDQQETFKRCFWIYLTVVLISIRVSRSHVLVS